MNLVPESAIIQQDPEQTFAEMRQGMVVTSPNMERRRFGEDDPLADVDVSIGCGNASPAAASDHVITTSRRRLQHVGGPEDCNNSTNFFCWMSCLEIPQANNAQGFINEGYSLYCVDPSVLVSTGNQVSKAVQPCNQAGETGRAMNSNCMGVWQPTAPGVPAQEVVVQGATNDIENSFCYGGTVMYMDGFNWVGSTCAIYLFQGWILSSVGKLFLACLGTVALGVLVEYSIRKRSQVIAAAPPGRRRLLLSAAFKLGQVFLGYIIMLIVMIYSAPLFISAIAGLVLGHVLFNAKDCLVASSKTCDQQGPSALSKDRETNSSSFESFCEAAEKTEAADPCEQEQGVTPCCQH